MEILNTYTEISSALLGGIFLLIIGCLSLAITILAIKLKDAFGFLFGLLAIAGIFFGILSISAPPTTTWYHEVIISDYNAIDFEKYEIIEHRGEIVVLKELSQEDKK